MQGNIQIEVLNESIVMVASHLKDVSEVDKQALIMTLANSLDLTPTDIILTSLMYPDFLAKFKCAKFKCAKTDLSNNRSNPDL